MTRSNGSVQAILEILDNIGLPYVTQDHDDIETGVLLFTEIGAEKYHNSRAA